MPDGSEYFGPFSDGQRHVGAAGPGGGADVAGTFKWPPADGRKYVGQWFNDKMHGKGLLT
jgi:hypothetical protein